MSSFDHVWGERNGGPAFPTKQVVGKHLDGRTDVTQQFHGISIRDLFAIQFAAAQCTATSRDQDFMNPNFVREQFMPHHSDHGKNVAQVVAERAYAMADAMLAERAKP